MDLLLRNVKLVDGQPADIVVNNGIIDQIAPAGMGEGKQVVDGTGLYASSGWIDLHVHADPELEPYGDEIDEIGIRQGVTTVVDAGSCGSDRIGQLVANAGRAKTRVLAFLNISRIGLLRTDELSRLEWIDESLIGEALKQYADFIVGLKARISQSVVKEQGLEPLRLARGLADIYGLPLMVHIGSGPPAIGEVLQLLQERDIVTHYLNGKANNVFDAEGKPRQALLDAMDRGVHLDVGHGTASFSFHTAELARLAGIKPHTISTDIYRGNRLNGPVYSMSDTLSKFLLLGYPLEEVISMVTANAAAWLGRPELGRIRAGEPANLTLFAVENGVKKLRDSEGEERIADHYIEARGVVVNGTFTAC
ncbi:amidohydrolase/deacetylase family metallohydrolase [Paenibacillus mendelii]|uniref:Amidohydrolase/deacetylase family metallohydrolase n=1 Tax=Paenibacillus mendelii TaxID=206163 RepID=A0ABV6J2R5_9BACL|nr:amidohydrolase/deacetylase family metallohydrolase [Paenibacillus mendelii]MCQ6559279.1 amidohydrolase/deacetylase family metallohydrolase [Paenibacillus mendelii]